ncbi:MAG: acetyl-CoA carboxylase biotin carboxyl carrier protein [Planctomycetota bacterium]|jgi:acetyl-CoA carboxylase biotin carboxyl carrier protein
MAQEDTDFQKIKKLIKIMQENDLVEVEIKHSDDKILLKRFAPQQPTVTAVPVIGQPPAAANSNQPTAARADAAREKEEALVDVTSPLVGTFYATPSPDSEAYVEVGSAVTPQTVVCIIEAMKVMNEIKAERSGKIAEILVANGEAVEFGQVLFRIKPD